MAQGAGYLADKATKESSDLATAMSNQVAEASSTTTQATTTTTMSIAEYNMKQEQLNAAKMNVIRLKKYLFQDWPRLYTVVL